MWYFCTFLDVKRQGIQKWPQNNCTCLSLQSGANFPEIAIGYGSPGIYIYHIGKRVCLSPIKFGHPWSSPFSKNTRPPIGSLWLYVPLFPSFVGKWISDHFPFPVVPELAAMANCRLSNRIPVAQLGLDIQLQKQQLVKLLQSGGWVWWSARWPSVDWSTSEVAVLY